MARRAEAGAMFNERFCRMWEYYWAMSETAFRYEQVVVSQLRIGRRQEAVDAARDIGAAGPSVRERRPVTPKRSGPGAPAFLHEPA
jgi:cyclopropane-fatty-acyl-phospholipid synthase